MRKGKFVLGFATLCLVTFGATSCGKTPDTPTPPTPAPQKVDVKDFTLEAGVSNNLMYKGEINSVVPMEISPSNATKEFEYVSSAPNIVTVNPVNGQITANGVGEAIITCTATYGGISKKITIKVEESASQASGGYNFQAKSYEEKAEIIGKLEGWALDNSLMGITLFQNGGYVLYNPRVKTGADKYIPGYGYGNLTDGEITQPAELANASQNTEWKSYYHSLLSTKPSNINYLNSQGSVTGDLYGYISTGLWSTKMNKTKTGYEWYPSLAISENPVPTNANASGFATQFEVKVKTYENSGLVYRTTSTKLGKYDASTGKGYDGRPVKVEDYINAYKQLLTKKNNLSRGAEMTSITSDGTLAGANAYYNLSDGGVDDELWNKLNVGIKVKEGTKDTLVFTLAKSTTTFYAKYSLASNLTMPFPEDFVTEINGMTYYGSNDSKHNRTVVDNILCLGPYMLESWNSDQNEIVFKKNDKYIDNIYKDNDESIKSRYKIPGIHCFIKAGADEQTVLNLFEQGVIDASSIPQGQLEKYASDPRKHETLGDSTFKLNVNSATQAQWDAHYEKVFKKKANSVKYTVKALMSNKNFLRGLNECINRKEYAESLGTIPSQDYFGDAYLYDPEAGLSYNDTVYHKANLATRFPETYGYDKDAAINHFKKALQECVAAGSYDLTNPNKNHETIDIYWMNTDDTKNYGAKIEEYIENAFNDNAVSGGKFTLDVVNHDGTSNYEDVYSKHLQVGNFDLGFGSISGNALNPLNFLEVLKSDDSSGFTLNWGVPTDTIDNTLVYEGKTWSFDSLFTAANSGTSIDSKGQIVAPFTLKVSKMEFNSEDKSYDVVISWTKASILSGSKDVKVAINSDDGIYVFVQYNKSQSETAYATYLVNDAVVTGADSDAGTITFKIKYDATNADNSDKIITGTKVTFQINYDMQFVSGSDTLTSSSYIEVKHTKRNPYQG